MIFKETDQDIALLDDILGDTYGTIVYQEQVMRLVRDLAGYTMGRSDLVRRAMSKKKQYVIDEERENFVHGNKELNIPGCIANGIHEDTANKIYDAMVDFAKYAFNKSHAACYSVVSFYTGYLKHYYCADYLAQVANYSEKIDEISGILEDARENGVKTLPPDINNSNSKFSVVETEEGLAILFGLGNIKSVGKNADEIIERRKEKPFDSVEDFLLRCNVNSGAFKSLVNAGAFDSLGYSRVVLRDSGTDGLVTDTLDIIKTIKDKAKFAAAAMKAADCVDDFSDKEEFVQYLKDNNISYDVSKTSKKIPTRDAILKRRTNALLKIAELRDELIQNPIPKTGNCNDDMLTNLANEKDALGLYLTGHPIDNYIVTTPDIADIEAGEIKISGCITDYEEKISKSGSKFAKFMLEDRSGSIRCNIFASDFTNIAGDIADGDVVCADGIVKIDDFNSTDETIAYCMNVKNLYSLKAKTNKRYELITTIDDEWPALYRRLAEFEDNAGENVYVIDSIEGVEYRLNFKVNEKILESDLGIVKK